MTHSRLAAALVINLLAPGTTACAEQAVPKPSIAAGALPPIAFKTSVVHDAPSALGRRYQVWVDLPPSYARSTKPIPVVFVLDPHWALPVTRSVRMLVAQSGRNIEDFILVGFLIARTAAWKGSGATLRRPIPGAIPRTRLVNTRRHGTGRPRLIVSTSRRSFFR